MKDEIISAIIATILTIIGAAVSHFYPEMSLRDSIYVGLFSYVTLLLHFWQTKVSQLENLRNSLDEITENTRLIRLSEDQAGSAFSIFWSICMIRARQGVYRIGDNRTLEIPLDKLPSFWQQAIIHAGSTWSCTSYVNSLDDINAEWSNRGFEFQAMLSKAAGVSVKRLFIFNTLDEINDDLLGHMRWHEKLGFLVRFIIRQDKEKWVPFGDLNQLCGSLDVAIVDRSYLIAFEIAGTKRREITRLVCYSDPNIVDRASRMLIHLWDAGSCLDAVPISPGSPTGQA